MLKINFIILFFLEILNLTESYNFIGQQHFRPQLKNLNFVRYGIGCKISITIIVLCAILLYIFIIFLDSTKLKIVWIKITFFKRRVSIIL